MIRLKDFTEFINESRIDEAGSTSPVRSMNGVIILAGKTSSSSVGDKVASEMGVKKNTIYELELPGIGVLANLARKEKYAGDFTKMAADNPKVKLTEKGSAKGDVLIVNDKEIKGGKGSISFLQSEVLEGDKAKPLNIKVANNGFIALVRLGAAMVNAASKVGTKDDSGWHPLSWYTAKNSSLELTLGGNPKDEESRVGSYCASLASTYRPSYNTFKITASAATVLCAAGPKVRVFEDPSEAWVVGIVNKAKPAKSTEEIINICGEYFNDTVNGLRKYEMVRHNMINTNDIDIKPLWEKYIADVKKYTSISPSRKGGGTEPLFDVKLNSEGSKAMNTMLAEIAKLLIPSSLPQGFGSNSEILKTAQEIVLQAFTPAKGSDFTQDVMEVQRKHTYGNVDIPGGVVSKENIKFKEGGII
jgi:hypothetical protein